MARHTAQKPETLSVVNLTRKNIITTSTGLKCLFSTTLWWYDIKCDDIKTGSMCVAVFDKMSNLGNTPTEPRNECI